MPLTQSNRPLRVLTPLGADQLVIVNLSGAEGLSRLFQFQLTLLAENTTKVEFDKLIGQPVAVELDLPGTKKRHFHGLCSRLTEGKRDDTFTRYRMEIVPQFWLLTRRTQSRIFQQLSVPDILKKVVKGLDVTFDLKGKYYPRDYLVQYRETDFDFASRLMEEEGIYYYFTHGPKGHAMVVADAPNGHRDVPEIPNARYDDSRGGNRPDLRVMDWEKEQELRSGKVTLWDHCFELPGKNLEAQKSIAESVAVGTVTHKLKLPGGDALELYDYPGAFAQRFDGIDPGGGDRPGDLEHIFEDNQRTAKLRMEQEAASALEARGTSNCAQFTAGHKFTLEKHFNGDGAYVLTEVAHNAKLAPDYRSGSGDVLDYTNTFTCLPVALPFRAPSRTPEPTIQGPQTATVVGPPGEAIHCDKYGRVKVKFHWDREGGADDGASCWVRVSQNWGGAKWGGMFIPHAGQEVIVEFEEGDPDRPLISGRVYNAAAMPPLELPAGKTQSAIRDHGGSEIILEGDDGKQRIRLFSPYFKTTVCLGAPHDPAEGFSVATDHFATFNVKKNVTWDVDGNHAEDIAGNEKHTVHGHRVHKTSMTSHDLVAMMKTVDVLGAYMVNVYAEMNEFVVISRTDETLGFRATAVGGYRTERVAGWSSLTVGRDHGITIGGSLKETVAKDVSVTVAGAYESNVTKTWATKAAGAVSLASSTATTGLTGKTDVSVTSETTKVTLSCGASSITLNHDGKITISGAIVEIKGTTEAFMHSTAKIRVAANDMEMNASGITSEASATHKIKGAPVKINCA